jgi:ubiquinone/menaquinone biosynthesis C-methylase UbiE
MLLNRVEKAMMNNPIRAAVQRRIEGALLERLGGPLPGPRVLEIGCGRGVGVEVLLDRFGAERVDGFDLDPEMVELARRRLVDRGARARLWVGDAGAIDAPDATYDAVFDFGIIHHIPDWRSAVREVHRVLRPGGRFYAEEVLDRFIAHLLWRRLLDHPAEDRFDQAKFADALRGAGFEVRATRGAIGWFGWFVAEKAGS